MTEVLGQQILGYMVWAEAAIFLLHQAEASVTKPNKPLAGRQLYCLHTLQERMEDHSCSYHCGTCDLLAAWSQASIVCETCGQWFHADRQSGGSKSFENLNASNITWHCIISSNFKYSRTVLDLFGGEREESETRISSIPSTDVRFNPLHASTPTAASRQNKQRTHPLSRLLSINFLLVSGRRADILNLLNSTKPDILIGTETWLNASI